MILAFRRGATGLSAAVFLVVASSVSAQSSKDCGTAAKIVSSGHLNATQSWAYLTLSYCGAVGANAFATGLPKYATVSDLAQLSDYMSHVDNWRDASILAAATQLAKNANATVQSRVFAIRHLILLLQPIYGISYAALVSARDSATAPDGSKSWFGGGCPAGVASEPRGTVAGAALPVGWEAQIRTTLSTLANSAAAPKPVRTAASCELPGVQTSR
jgi:hypothetical protein